MVPSHIYILCVVGLAHSHKLSSRLNVAMRQVQDWVQSMVFRGQRESCETVEVISLHTHGSTCPLLRKQGLTIPTLQRSPQKFNDLLNVIGMGWELRHPVTIKRIKTFMKCGKHLREYYKGNDRHGLSLMTGFGAGERDMKSIEPCNTFCSIPRLCINSFPCWD